MASDRHPLNSDLAEQINPIEPETQNTGLFDAAYLPFLPHLKAIESTAAKLIGLGTIVAAGAVILASRARLKNVRGLGMGSSLLESGVESGAKLIAQAANDSAEIVSLPFIRASRLGAAAATKKPGLTTIHFGRHTSITGPEDKPLLTSLTLPGEIANENLPLAARVTADWTTPAAPRSHTLTARRDFPAGLSHELYPDAFRIRFPDQSSWTRHADGTEVAEESGRLYEILRPDGAVIIDGELITAKPVRIMSNELKPVAARPDLNPGEEIIRPWSSPDGAVTVFKDGSVFSVSPRQDSLMLLPGGQKLFDRRRVTFETVKDSESGSQTTYFSNGWRHTVSESDGSTFEHDLGKTSFDARTGKSIQEAFGSKTIRWPSGFTMSDTGSGYISFLDRSGDHLLELNQIGLVTEESSSIWRAIQPTDLNMNLGERLEDGSTRIILPNRARLLEDRNGTVSIFDRTGRLVGKSGMDGSLESDFSRPLDPFAGMTETPGGFRIDFVGSDGDGGSIYFKGAMPLDPHHTLRKAALEHTVPNPPAKVINFPAPLGDEPGT